MKRQRLAIVEVRTGCLVISDPAKLTEGWHRDLFNPNSPSTALSISGAMHRTRTLNGGPIGKVDPNSSDAAAVKIPDGLAEVIAVTDDALNVQRIEIVPMIEAGL